jgi:hypothetical protein
LRVGDQLTVHLSSPQQAVDGFDATTGAKPRGPAVLVRIVGVLRSPFWIDSPGDSGGVLPSYAFTQKYRSDILGPDPGHSPSYINALITLKDGAAAVPRFKADLARVTGRSDIDVWDIDSYIGGPVRKATGYEAACLLAFALAALLAALFLVGQAVARYAAGGAENLRVLQAVGLTRRQAAVAAALGPGLAAAAGAVTGVAAALVASRWMPIGLATLVEPHPGFDADWLVLGPGAVVAVLLVTAGSAGLTWAALTAGPARPRRGSVIAAAAGWLPVAALIGARFALEPGRGRSSVPVVPALAGAVAGVLGVLAAFTFSAGVSDAAAHPERFGVTWQLEGFYGENGQDFGPANQVSAAVAARPDVAGFLDARIGGAQASGVSIETYEYRTVGGKPVATVLTAGAMPDGPAQIVLAPTTARSLHAGVGSVLRLTGGQRPQTETVTGIGFVPTGAHNDYDEGAWISPAGYDRLFSGAHYGFKFHVGIVALRPGVNPARAAVALTATAAAVHGGAALSFGPADLPDTVQMLTDLAQLPTALGAFLALLAVGAVGYALSTAVRRRGRELGVLRALGLTSGQSRLVIITQATLLALAGLVAGIPLGLAVGQSVWQAVAGLTPLAYQPPLAPWALALIAPGALLAANLLALWPGWRAARLRPAQILRAE